MFACCNYEAPERIPIFFALVFVFTGLFRTGLVNVSGFCFPTS